MRSGISVEDMDREVRPQDDLFGYVNGGWVARTQIPSDRALHGTFRILADDAEQHLRAIVEEAAAADAEPGTPTRKVGDLYAAFMDVDRVRELGLAPVRGDLDAALAVPTTSDLMRQLGRLQRRGVQGAVELYVMTDKRNSTRYLPYLEQSGLGLPDESYYRDESFAAIRQEYVAHIGRMLSLAGIDADGAPDRIMALETRLALGPLGPGPQPGRRRDVHAARPGRPAGAGSRPRLGRVARGRRGPGVGARRGRRAPTGLPRRPGPGPRRRPDRGLGALAGLARPQRQRAVPR